MNNAAPGGGKGEREWKQGGDRPCEQDKFGYQECPNMKMTYGDFDGERYRCDKCGKSYYLDYEEMK